MAKANEQIAHLWAHGQAAQGGNMSTDGRSLFSYSTVIATRIEGVVFMTSNNMSPTTASKHLPAARRAVSYNYFLSPAFSYGNGYALTAAEYIQAAAEEHAEAFKALCRKRNPDADRYMERRQEIIDTAARFNVEIPEIPEATGDLKEKARKFAEAKREAEKKALLRREEEQRAQQIVDQGELDLWLQFGRGRYPRSFYRRGADQITIKAGYIGLERNPDADTVITSQGAEAPLDHVKKALEFYDTRELVKLHRPSCEGVGRPGFHSVVGCTCGAGEPEFTPYHTNGHKIPLGHFTLDSIDEQGNVKAGCHYFTAAEIARFRKQWEL